MPRLHLHHGLSYPKVNKNMCRQYHDVMYEIKADIAHLQGRPLSPTLSRVMQLISRQDILRTPERPWGSQVQAVSQYLLRPLFSHNHPREDNPQTNVGPAAVGRKSNSAVHHHQLMSETCPLAGDLVSSGHPAGPKRKLFLVPRPVPEISLPSVSQPLAQGAQYLILRSTLSGLVEMPNV